MRVLIVEDDTHNLEELENEIVAKFPEGEIVIAKSRDSALAQLESSCFDAVILDRNIPSYDDAMDANVIYGEVLYSYIINNLPGTIIRFWTAFFNDEYISEKVNRDVKQEDAWGSGEPIATVGIIPKARFDVLHKFISKVQEEKKALSKIEIRSRPTLKLTLTDSHKKLLKVFARRQGGNAVEVANLTGGLSSSSVVRASVFSGGKKIVSAAGKLSTIDRVKDETERQRKVNNLAPGSFTVLLDQVRVGAGIYAATFYRLADDYNQSLFDLLIQNPQLAGTVIEELRNISSPWINASTEQKQSIKQLRQRFVSDEIFDRISLELPELISFEAREVDTLISIQHCDMHGENILLNNRHQPILIDYSDVDLNHAAVDPITLELSAIFHPNGFCKQKGWPNLSQAVNWCNLDIYLADCPIVDYVRKCRDWAYEVAPGNLSYSAMAYVYILRQLKYEDTDHELAKTLLKCLLKEFM